MSTLHSNLKAILSSDKLEFFCKLAIWVSKGDNWTEQYGGIHYSGHEVIIEQLNIQLSRSEVRDGPTHSFLINIVLPVWELLISEGLIKCEGYILSK